MKKTIISFFTLLGMISLLQGCGVKRMIDCKKLPKLNVFNWGEYIDDDVLFEFEAKNGVCINYSTFSDNETAITKMKTEKYDLVFPSEYAIEQLYKEDLIEKIDWTKLSVDKDNIFVDSLMQLINKMKETFDYDFLDHAVPYLWGSVGIIYNPNKVSLEKLQQENWNILRDKTLNMVFYDSSKDAFMVALKQLGYSMNTTNKTEINEATKWLKNTLDNNKKNLALLTDEILDSMPTLEYDLAICYSGDANYIMEKNPTLRFYKPTNGTNVWVDGIVIPKNALNQELAYKFIDFLLTHEVALKNTEYVGYTTPIKSVYNEVISEGGSYEDFIDSYVIEVTDFDEMYKYLGADIKSLMEGEWMKVKI